MAKALNPDRHTRERPSPGSIEWRTGAWAGVVAGLVFMMAEMALVVLAQGESPWGPPRMMAAILMGQGVLAPPPSFDLAVMAAAMAVHLPLSILYGLAIGWIVHRLGTVLALAAGAALGLAIYFVNFYPIAAAAFPWFAMARGWVSVAAHALFGLIAAGSYVALRRKSRA